MQKPVLFEFILRSYICRSRW